MHESRKTIIDDSEVSIQFSDDSSNAIRKVEYKRGQFTRAFRQQERKMTLGRDNSAHSKQPWRAGVRN